MNEVFEKVLAAGESLFLLNIATAIRVRNAKRMNDQDSLRSIQGNLNRTGETRRNMAFYGTIAVVVLIIAFGPTVPLLIAGAAYYAVQTLLHAYARQTVDDAVRSTK